MLARLVTVVVFIAVGTACSAFKSAGIAPAEVLFVTTRAQLSEDQKAVAFSDDRGQLHAGVIGIGFDASKVSSIHAGEPPNPLSAAAEPAPGNYYSRAFAPDSLAQHLQHYPEKQAIIYIHGYKRTFDETVQVGARLRYELKFPGPLIVFSWPSKNAYSGYMADAVNIQWSEPQLQNLITDISEQLPGYRLNFIAHSMGNRALVNVLVNLASRMDTAAKLNIGEVVMVAPDIDRAIFTSQHSGELLRLPAHYTLYVSSEDFPLMASAVFNAYPRLGDSRGGVPVISGMDTVDASEAITMTTGHTYFRKNSSALADLYQLVVEGKAASQRSTLDPVESRLGKYWRLKK